MTHLMVLVVDYVLQVARKSSCEWKALKHALHQVRKDNKSIQSTWVKLVVVMSAYIDCHAFLVASFPEHSPSNFCCLQWYNCTAGTCDCSKPCYQYWPCSLSLLPPLEMDWSPTFTSAAATLDHLALPSPLSPSSTATTAPGKGQ